MSIIRDDDDPKFVLGLLLVALLALVAWTRIEPKAIRWFHPHAFVPTAAVVTFQVHIPLNPRNRYAELYAFEGDIPVQVTRINLERETRRTLWDNAKWRLPVGELALVAAVFGVREDGSQGELARDVFRVTVYDRLGGF